ncbi:hypothetical protein G7Y89_g5049 [Cudoniella acicularis]|uniref:Heterokaryon incompatibility domain-containing protein n=1 Tax=Cudoniella acicularis TaxID=354080 RepID=A0A8H4W3Q8_9HELO|nr:hypothetical protein G7Y89_g5049 [Cudoniella acicularis]
MQGSKEDWTREASLMGDIYANGFCNLVATDSDNGESCLAQEERASIKSGLYKPIVAKPGDSAESFIVADPHIFRDVIDRALLNSRDWVVQEGFLAPQTLHFIKKQVFWECRQRIACDTFPKGLPRAMVHSDPPIKYNGAIKNSSANNPLTPNYTETLKATIYQEWEQLVTKYSTTELTYASDLLIAISGLARRFSIHLQAEYIAGL